MKRPAGAPVGPRGGALPRTRPVLGHHPGPKIFATLRMASQALDTAGSGVLVSASRSVEGWNA